MSLFGGKTKTQKKDPLANDINATGKSGLVMLRSGAEELDNTFYSNPNDYVDSQINIENRLLRNASEDATRRTKSLIAQRGMGMSSIGLGQEVNQARSLSERLALNNATGMDRIKGLLNEKMNTGNQLFATKTSQGPIQMTDLKYKTGGIGKLLGTAVGAAAGGYFGGGQGAAAGAQVGGALGDSF